MDLYRLADADQVLPKVKAGDPAAQEELYRAFEAPVYSLARRICRTAEDAEDVLQETFLEVFRSIGRFRGGGSLWGGVRTTARSEGRGGGAGAGEQERGGEHEEESRGCTR